MSPPHSGAQFVTGPFGTQTVDGNIVEQACIPLPGNFAEL
jgi:hypothetical protein